MADQKSEPGGSKSGKEEPKKKGDFTIEEVDSEAGDVSGAGSCQSCSSCSSCQYAGCNGCG